MIFTLVLTIAYAIYYAVVIAKDLQGKKGRTHMEEEESVQVSESGDSFHVGDSENRPTDPIREGNEDASEQPAEKLRNAAEEKAEQLKSNLLEADITSEDGMTAPELHELLESKRETLFKIPMKITRNEI